jgi:GNAT superfamily N-acetyltransferase
VSESAKLIFKPVTKETWTDFETLFESRGGPHHCWCTVWQPKVKDAGKNWKKNYMKNRVEKNIPVGLLAYSANQPVAWCSVAPRETYRNLSGDNIIGPAWSLVCFFIKREFRGSGLSRELINEAKKYAAKNGAKYLEAYPVSPGSHSYRFMGYVPLFEEMGFRFVKMAGTKRHVMITDLNS